MTDEQIKQNAEICVFTENSFRKEHKKLILTPSEEKIAKDFFIAGAHSMFKEIKHLERIAATYKSRCQDTAAECERLHDIIDQLRNPWISVEDRLPREDTDVLCIREDGFYLIGKVLNGGKWYCYGFGWQAKNKITHWMYIPELKKKE